ncbi:ATP-dependent DNA helicase [Thermicanus aegyptius]|uniref:ATP-dependent DNA helicase n=1 Tax=Thermicanus aegyptius TaxID=94009 RepID=UPI00048C0B84|nr:helicase C-terminal domain-containing protein [Thermicanus aegyptius]
MEGPMEVKEKQSNLPMEDLLRRLEDIFASHGILSEVFPDYRPRAEQMELSKEILLSLFEEEHLFAEAGTGTGKSFAYLMAAALYALETGKVVLISTNTLPLQNQLMEKDLPVVEEVMRRCGYGEFRYELAKGRGNYICRRRLELLIATVLSEANHPWRETVKEISLYIEEAKRGVREEFPFYIPWEIWNEIGGDYEDCFHQYSPFYEKCFIQNARKSWSKANLLVANHALVFADLSMKGGGEGGVLPRYDCVIFDEGHRVEESFSRFFERSVSLPQLDHLMGIIRQRRQGWMRNVFDAEVIQEIGELFQPLRERLEEGFTQLAEYLADRQRSEGLSPLTPVMEMIESPLPVRVDVEKPIERIIDYLKGIEAERCGEEVEKRGIALLMGRIQEIGENFRFITQGKGGDGWAHWLEKNPPSQAGLLDPQAEWIRAIAQPIDAKQVMQEFYEKVPVTFISATMATGGDFEYMAKRLGIPSYRRFIAGSPFDYRKNALLVISELAPDPRREEEYISFLVQGILRILQMTRGRTLVLFTSFSLLEKTGNALLPYTHELGIQLLLHLPGEDRSRLIEEFRANPQSVLFGCDSFWEGIDLPGDELRCVVITKLPFANPQEPLAKAKMRLIEKEGGDGFRDWMLPSAILKMKQGVGRLIRTTEDRGAIVIMDSRILTKQYGRRFLMNLPPARRGKLKEITHYVSDV